MLDEILHAADDELRLAIMMQKLNDDVSSIFRQVACYRFEQELHKDFRAKGYLSKEEIGKLFQKHMAAYMGNAVLQSEGSENWWVYWNHIRYFFYVYSYASGLLHFQVAPEFGEAGPGVHSSRSRNSCLPDSPILRRTSSAGSGSIFRTSGSGTRGWMK